MLRPDPGPDPERVDAIARLLENQEPEPIQPSNHTRSFLLSAVLFLGIGSAGGGLLDGAFLLAAVFLHELGHFAAMRLFGYRNARILFLPFFGGVTVGEQVQPDAFQRAAVSLAGPAPSILIGAALAFAAFPLHNVLVFRAAMTMLSINLLNLLPVAGLDGGNFVQRSLGLSPKPALAFRLLTGGLGAAWALWTRSPLMGLWFGAMTLSAWTVEYPRDVICRKLSERPPAPQESREKLAWLIKEIESRQAAPGKPAIEGVAREAAAVWTRARDIPVTGRRRLGLLAAYASCWAVGLIGVFGWRLLLR